MILRKQYMCDGFGSNVDDITAFRQLERLVCVDSMENHFGNASQAQYKSYDKQALNTIHCLSR